MQHDWIDKLSAYLDGEMDSQERIEVEAALESDPALVEILEQMSRVEASLRPAYAATFHEAPPSRLTDLVLVPSESERTASAWLRRWLAAPALAAAGIALTAGFGIGTGVATMTADSGLYSIAANGQLVPNKALMSTLASAPSGEIRRIEGVPVVVHLSLSNADGYCRQVQTGSLTALWCKSEGDDWRVMVAATALDAPTNDSSYSMAGDGTPDAIIDAIKGMDGVTLLDRSGEELAIESGWIE